MKDKNPVKITMDAYGELVQIMTTPLHLAAENGHHEVVTTIIHRIVFLHPRNDNGDTPFHLAANNGHTQVLASFLRRMKHKSPRHSNQF